MRKIRGKKAAFELGMNTIVVVVLSILLLIMGFLLIRNIMCGAITATGEINQKVISQINDFFGSSQGEEVSCIGAGDVVTLLAGEPANVWCSIKASQTSDYKFSISINKDFSTIPERTIDEWVSNKEKEWEISPRDREPKKIIKLNIPKNAQEGEIAFDMDVSIKSGGVYDKIWSQVLEFKIDQPGAIKGFMC